MRGSNIDFSSPSVMDRKRFTGSSSKRRFKILGFFQRLISMSDLVPRLHDPIS